MKKIKIINNEKNRINQEDAFNILPGEMTKQFRHGFVNGCYKSDDLILWHSHKTWPIAKFAIINFLTGVENIKKWQEIDLSNQLQNFEVISNFTPVQKKKNTWQTTFPNFSWDAGGRGRTAGGWMYLEFEKISNCQMLVVGCNISTTTATGVKRDSAVFSGERDYFEKIIKVMIGKIIDISLTSTKKEITKKIQDKFIER